MTGGTAVLILVFGSVSVLRKQDLDAADLAFAFEAANTSNEMDWILTHICFFLQRRETVVVVTNVQKF